MKTFFQIIFILFFSLNALAQQNLLEKANEHYTNQEYHQAIEAYNEILNGNLESAEVYFNLGNAYFKSGQVTQAIINYERAKLLAPKDEDIQFNLELANQHVVDAIDPLPKVFFIRWWNNIANQFSTDGWAKISISSFILVLILSGLFLFTRTIAIKRLSFWLGIFIIGISIFSYNFAARQKNRMKNHNFAIITQPSVTVKSSPSESGTDLFLIHEGLKVEIKDSLGNWIEVRIADGNQGWLPVSYIEKI